MLFLDSKVDTPLCKRDYMYLPPLGLRTFIKPLRTVAHLVLFDSLDLPLSFHVRIYLVRSSWSGFAWPGVLLRTDLASLKSQFDHADQRQPMRTWVQKILLHPMYVFLLGTDRFA